MRIERLAPALGRYTLGDYRTVPEPELEPLPEPDIEPPELDPEALPEPEPESEPEELEP